MITWLFPWQLSNQGRIKIEIVDHSGSLDVRSLGVGTIIRKARERILYVKIKHINVVLTKLHCTEVGP